MPEAFHIEIIIEDAFESFIELSPRVYSELAEPGPKRPALRRDRTCQPK